MEKYYTTKQVQELFNVDRITVYRMLQDGRLKGVKIGKHWRFPEKEIERMLGGEESGEAGNNGEQEYPVHCFQAIQDLFSSVSNKSALILDQQGNPVTEITGQCAFCKIIQSNASGKNACLKSWKEILQSGTVQNGTFTCHAGINYVGTSIVQQNEVQGMFLMGEVFLSDEAASHAKKLLPEIATKYDLDINVLQTAFYEIVKLSKQ